MKPEKEHVKNSIVILTTSFVLLLTPSWRFYTHVMEDTTHSPNKEILPKYSNLEKNRFLGIPDIRMVHKSLVGNYWSVISVDYIHHQQRQLITVF
jgi:hypothetical protein